LNRTRTVTPFLAYAFLVAGTWTAHAAPGLLVERVVHPDAAARAAARGAPLLGEPMRPEEVRAHELRSARWRSFDDVLGHPDVNWSRFAARRPGWSLPRRPSNARRGDPRPALETGTPLPPPDTIRVAIIRIDFLADREGGASTGNGRFDLSGPDTTQVPIDRPPRNRTYFDGHALAVKRYFDSQTYGRSLVEGLNPGQPPDIWPPEQDGAYHVSDLADFGPWSFDQSIFRRAVHMFRTFLFAADSQSTLQGNRIPWDRYDRFVLLHAGSDLQNDVANDSPRDIPSFTIGVVDTDVVIFPDSTTRPIDRAALVPETSHQDGFYGAINGVFAHECGHLFYGFADLYNTETGIPTVGLWSLMDSGNLTGARLILSNGTQIFATGLLPPSIDPFHRQFASDIYVPPEASYGDTITLGSSQRNPDVFSVTLSSDEYLLVENRYIAAQLPFEFDQDPTTRVILGPKLPDLYEYDALLPTRMTPDEKGLPSGGILVWHVDESVIPLEFDFPLDTTLRANPDLGINTNPLRPGVSVIEADGLDDLGDLSSPFILGAPLDPFFRSNYPTLSDTTQPSLVTHAGTRPHVRLDFLDEPDYSMRVWARRTWQLPNSPVLCDFPPGGPQLAAIDVDGDRDLDLCWAGGDSLSADSTALFVLEVDGSALDTVSVLARLPRRPRPLMASLATGAISGPGLSQRGPSLFAATTYAAGPDTSFAGGRVYLLDHLGQVQPGWPPPLPAVVTTPPVIAGGYPNAAVYVGCADGLVYRLGLDGARQAVSDAPLIGGVVGRLAVAGLPGEELVAAGGGQGQIAILQADLATRRTVPISGAGAGFDPEFLWIHLDGATPPPAGQATCVSSEPQLVLRDADRLWAFCAQGDAIPGWGRDLGDTLVASLGAGDPDGDGLPEVLVQSLTSWVGFVNRNGAFSPGWPKRGTREGFTTRSPALAVDVDGDRRGEIVAMNASGIVTAFRHDGATPAGWPLASGVGTAGAPVAADLDGNGTIEIAAPDRFAGVFVYTFPASAVTAPPDEQVRATSWTMVGGDPGRTQYLPIERTGSLAAATAGPVLDGSFVAYPNPARRAPVNFAFRLTEPADVQFRIFDTSGHLVDSFSRAGRQSDNIVTWEPGELPAGLYLAQVRFSAASGTHYESIPVGVLR
jgi:M6 family metalloprotease-like protein